MKPTDGDHPDMIVQTYHRCASAASLTRDLIKVLPSEKWASAAIRMMDRDLLADELWWKSVLTMRDRRLGRPPQERMPSYSTRITAGHLLAMAASAAEELTVSNLIESHAVNTDSDQNPPDGGWTMQTAYQRAMQLSGGVCGAIGLHHPQCPGQITDRNASEFSAHHRFTRAQGKQRKIPIEFIDRPSNLIIVWNQYSLGAGGCHGKIHTESDSARRLGLLAEKGEIPDGYEPPEQVAFLKPERN